MNANVVRVAVIGCGRVSGHHCRSIVATEGVELVAVCDLIKEKAALYGKEFNVPYFTSYRKMFESRPHINTVAVVTPSGMHYEHVTEMLQLYRKHIIVEKPTFMRPSQLIAAYALAGKLGLQIFPVFQNRHNRAVRRVREALQNGELGDIRIAAVRVRWCRPQRYYQLAPWRGTFSHDGGALTNQGIHHVDLLRYLAGKVNRVNATMRTLGADIEVEDTVVASLTFAKNAVGVLEVTTAARPDDFEASLSLVCEKGLAQIGGIAVNELQIFTPDSSVCASWSEDFSGNVYGYGHQQMYRDISACMNKNIPYPVDMQDCLGTIELLHAFYRSDEAGGWVNVESTSEARDSSFRLDRNLLPSEALNESTRLGRPDEELSNLYRTPPLNGDVEALDEALAE